MTNTKTYQMLLLFSEKELAKLSTFILSDYFNSEKNVTKLFIYFITNINKKPTKIAAFENIYPQQKFNLSRLNYLSTTLYNLFKKFIVVENLLTNSTLYETSVLKKMRLLNQKRLYSLEENIIINKNEKYIKKKSVDYQQNYLFEYERLDYYSEQKRTETKYIDNLHFNLDAYYFIEKLKASCTSLNQRKLYNTRGEQGFTNALIKHVEKVGLIKKVPLLSVYYNAYKMLAKNDKAYFKELKNNLEIFNVDVKEITDAFIFGLNFCIKKINDGNTSFNNEMFEMYRTGIKKGILLKQGKLSSITFSNVVTIGLRLKRYDDVEFFIEDNKKLLLPLEKKSYYAFNLAKVYFERSQFEKVTELYNEKLIKEILLNIQMRILQIKAFYELGEFDICESLVLSTDQLLNRKGILAYHKLVFKNYIKITKQILSLNTNSKASITKLKNIVLKTEKIIDKNWLLKIINSFL